jgi:hypothetical protein
MTNLLFSALKIIVGTDLKDYRNSQISSLMSPVSIKRFIFLFQKIPLNCKRFESRGSLRQTNRPVEALKVKNIRQFSAALVAFATASAVFSANSPAQTKDIKGSQEEHLMSLTTLVEESLHTGLLLRRLSQWPGRIAESDGNDH